MTRILAVLLTCCLAAAASCSKAPLPEQEPAAQTDSASDRAEGAQAQYSASVEGSPVVVGGLAAPRVAGKITAAPASPWQGPPGEPPMGGQVPVPKDRKLIRDAQATLEVRAVDDALTRLRTLAE